MKKYNFYQIILSVFLLTGSFNVYGQGVINGPHELSASSWDSNEHFNPCFICNPDTSATSYNGFMISHKSDSLTVSDSIYTSDISKLCSTCHDSEVESFSHSAEFYLKNKMSSGNYFTHSVTVNYHDCNSDKIKLCNPDIVLSVLECTITSGLQAKGRVECTSCHDKNGSENKYLIK